jgi:hypothetical protein
MTSVQIYSTSVLHVQMILGIFYLFIFKYFDILALKKIYLIRYVYQCPMHVMHVSKQCVCLRIQLLLFYSFSLILLPFIYLSTALLFLAFSYSFSPLLYFSSLTQLILSLSGYSDEDIAVSSSLCMAKPLLSVTLALTLCHLSLSL